MINITHKVKRKKFFCRVKLQYLSRLRGNKSEQYCRKILQQEVNGVEILIAAHLRKIFLLYRAEFACNRKHVFVRNTEYYPVACCAPNVFVRELHKHGCVSPKTYVHGRRNKEQNRTLALRRAIQVPVERDETGGGIHFRVVLWPVYLCLSKLFRALCLRKREHSMHYSFYA